MILSLDYSNGDAVPKLLLGSRAGFHGSSSIYTVVKVTPKGGTAVLKRDSDGKEVKVKRARVSRRSVPMELGMSDVTPRYYDSHGRQVW